MESVRAVLGVETDEVGTAAPEMLGKTAGANSMMRELGGVFGVAVLATVFNRPGVYASPETFVEVQLWSDEPVRRYFSPCR